ncbi:hypothetical protein [Rhodococcus sp. HS-D2]|uniref:hypothetical protein n=1 Tax=Rhodococcus sp. HS-D2 TaxID=1384636 RepID=UPI000A7ABBC3|nr:hypothetical protein [Rhodococcus sp. HS-D2]
MGDSSRHCIAVASVDFGWGGTGALANILTALGGRNIDTDIVLIGSRLGRHLISTDFHIRYEPSLSTMVRSGSRPGVVVSVLDAETAKESVQLEIPVVFVDLLPFLWGASQRDWVPYDADVYLAQSVAGLGNFSSVLPAHAQPIEAVISSTVSSTEAANPNRIEWDCTIVLGGLLSPQQSDRDGYVRAVVPSILRVLSETGSQSVRVVGNLSSDAIARISALCLDLRLHHEAGPVPPSDFGQLLRRSKVIAAQPGLMTLLEASASGRPLVRLPPQNVAGVVQTAGFDTVVGPDGAMHWPDTVVDIPYLLELRAEGEETANDHCYRMINSFTAQQDWQGVPFIDAAREAFRCAQTVHTRRRRSFFEQSGSGGADQVAAHIQALLSSKARA